jgi:DNA-binding NarL/FixJ family response regulator/tetratricopeptide (TPR) repeat protein
VADALRRRAFIGRSVQLAYLRDALHDTEASGIGRSVVIGGEAGIGKSRLVERFVGEIGSGAKALSGACLEVGEDALPYAPFVEILRALVRDTPTERLPAVLGPGRAELTRLLPELAARAADLAQPAGPDRASQARLFELILGVLERMAAEQSLVVVIEDVHWADRSTRDLIGFLARALRDDRVLLVLTTRTDAAGDAVGNLAFLAELEREDNVERLELQPFDRDEIAEQASGLLDEPPEPAVVDRLLARSDGNPFYVEELILARAVAGPGLPPVLRDVVAARVARLSPAARDVLRAAAAAGRRVDDELLAAALDRSPRDLAGALREAVDSGILVRRDTADGPVLAFRHALLHEVVDGELMGGERAALHAAFAEALEARLAAGDQAVADVEIARHWDSARQPARALPFTIRAAGAAEQVYAFPEAQRLWERAGAMFERLGLADEVEGRDLADVLLRGAECAVLTSEPSRAVELAQRALIALYPTGDQERLALLENRHRWYLWWAGQRAQAAAAVRRALATMPTDPPSLELVRTLAQEAGILMFAGDYEASRDRAQEAIDLARRLGAHGEVALALGVLGWDLALLGDVDGGIAKFREGQAIGEALGSVEGMALAATNLAGLLDRIGRSRESLDAALQGFALTERFGVARTYGAVLLGHAAKAQLALGLWDEADRSTSDGLRRGAVDGGAEWLQINRARLLVGRGRSDEAAVLLRRARAIEKRLGGTEYATPLLAAEAELAAWSGEVSALVEVGERGLGALAPGGMPDPSLAWLAAQVMRGAADAKLAIGAGLAGPADDPIADRADRLVTGIRAAVAEAMRRPGFVIGERAGAVLALLNAEGARYDGRATPDAWSDVAARWVSLARPFHAAYARLRQAEALLASRDREMAAAVLGETIATAAALGAAPLQALAMGLAGQARLTLPPTDSAAVPMAPAAGRDDPYELTPREAEVLRLVAAGWTNQQIADELFIARKTASVHVSNLMGKLGATNRGEAAALAHRLGLVPEVPLPVGHG